MRIWAWSAGRGALPRSYKMPLHTTLAEKIQMQIQIKNNTNALDILAKSYDNYHAKLINQGIKALKVING